MSGVLFMMRLWKYVDTKKLDNKSKANIFLIMNIILWSGIAFLLSLIAVSSVAIVPNGWSGQ